MPDDTTERHYRNKDDSIYVFRRLIVLVVGVAVMGVIWLAVSSLYHIILPPHCDSVVEVQITAGDTIDGKIIDMFPPETNRNRVKDEISYLNQDRYGDRSLGDVRPGNKFKFPNPKVCSYS
ncbi:MAG: hypothetical protein Q8P54_02935 [bacterium]|nr:hypothetical protein [bacterium]